MVHDLAWLKDGRGRRRMRRLTPLGLLLACALLLCAQAASAAPYDMRGEWSIEFKSQHEPAVTDTGVFDKMNNTTGEFSGTFRAGASGGGLEAKLEGTLSGTTVSLTSSTQAPFGTVSFICKEEATLNTTNNTFSGTGAYYLNGKFSEAGEVSARRLRSYQEIVEQEERERKEREEQRLREEVRGEWEITVGTGEQSFKGIALITKSANSKDEFAASSAIYQGVNPGTFTGAIEGSTVSVEVKTPPYAPANVPGTTFTGKGLTFAHTLSAMSISGSGNFAVENGPKFTTTMTATRIKTYSQVVERETAEREAKEQKEKEEREAKEKTEREEREAKEKAEREQREKLEKEKALPLKVPPIVPPPPPPPAKTATLPPLLGTKSATVGATGALLLALSNPNEQPEQGHLTVTLAKTGKTSSSKHKAKSTTLGQASFSIAGKASTTVKVTLSKSGRAELERLKTTRVLVTLTIQTAGAPTSTTKTYSLTLHFRSPGRHKG